MERPLDKRNVLTLVPERAKQGVVLVTDVEGPLFLGDFIAEAMSNWLKPEFGFIDASPSYGSIMYQETWAWFTQKTLLNRRTLDSNKRPKSLSNSQEGTDTIFTMPLLLAEGATYTDLLQLTLKSKATPGSRDFVKTIESHCVIVIGLTTAPHDPFRVLV